MNLVIYFIFMFFLFFLMFMLSIILFWLDLSLIFEWLIFSVLSLNLEVLIFLDWISCLFISVVMLISSMIMLYSIMYMIQEKFMKRFINMVNLFIFSMILLIISPNILSIMLGWDGLGVTSYCLVIYYQNYSSYNSGMLTVLSNRIGDVGLLMSISLMMTYGSWNMMLLKMDKVIIFFMILASVTKSAQIPFSSWLPSAMAAPTPVSALVHSSTLVTAGVYLMIRFNKYLMSSELNLYLLYLSTLTMFMSGVMANLEFDLKKIIALSTLSQLGLMMMILSLGYYMMAFYHLVMHAIFKSMLFMCAGIIIHSMNNNQDIRVYGNLNEFLPFTMMSFYISLMALTGMLFFSGFYSKDLIMELIYMNKINSYMYMMIVISLIFTVSYSVRLFMYLFFSGMKFMSFNNLKENYLMNFSMYMLIICSIILGSVTNWLFFYYFISPFLSFMMKLFTLELCLLGIFLGMIVKFFYIMKFYYFSYFLSSMWFMNYMWNWVYKPYMEFSNLLYKVDKEWMEFFWGAMFVNLIYGFKNYIMSYKYKIFMFMNFFMVFIFLILMF